MPSRKTIIFSAAGLMLLIVISLALWSSGSDQPAATSESHSDHTAKTVVAAGDIACDANEPASALACRQGDTARLIAALEPTAVLTLGDNQYPDGALASFQDSYAKSWGVFKDITFPVPGNHEYQTPDAAGYFDYFGSRAGERGKGYYAFSVGAWRFIALNSEIDLSENSAQLAWLKQELKTHPAACTLAYWHEPRFSTGGHPDDSRSDATWRVLYANNVDVVLNGHSHAYERFAPQNPDGQIDQTRGITEFVSGMGGRAPEALNDPSPLLATRQNHAFGVLVLTLHGSSARYEFVPIPGGQQTFSDSGVVACH